MALLKCSILQYPIIWQSPEENLLIFEEAISKNPVDLIILPEMFNTGFTNDVDLIHESMLDPTVSWMKEMSRTYNVAICGSLIIKEADKYFNRFVFAADGVIQSYDKRHLFSMGGEDKGFTAGSERITITWRTWRIFPIVCYDLRFPVWCRNDLDYDLMVCVANWPVPRIYHWDQLLISRAIENQAYVIGCNRIGQDGNGLHYNGHSTAIDPSGNYILTPSEQQGVHSFTLNKDEIQLTRQRLPFQNDRDSFSII